MGGSRALGWLAFALTGVAAPALALADPRATAERFGALQDFDSVSIAPDGSKVAIVSTVRGGTKVVVAELAKAAPPKSPLAISAKDGRITDCVWTTVSRLVCTARYVANETAGLVTYTRMFGVNTDGSALVQLSARTEENSHYGMQSGGAIIDLDVGDKPGTVLMTRQFVPSTQVGWRIGSDQEGYGVELVDTTTLRRQTVEQPRLDAGAYIADGHGVVRVMRLDAAGPDGILKGKSRYQFRKIGTREWLPLSEVTLAPDGISTGFEPVAVDSTKNVAYGFEARNGYTVLSSLSLDGNATRAEVLSRPDTDVDELIQIGRSGRVVGGAYANERRTVDYFDPDLKKLAAALSRALPGAPLISIVDASADENTLLIVAASDTDPGVLYRYDKAAHHLDEVMPLRSALEGQALAQMKAIQYKAADGTDVPAYLTLPVGSAGKGLPAIVMPHGGPAFRDEWGFDWIVQFFAARGYAVLQPNYRGSSGLGAEWYRKNGFQSWRTAMSDINDAGRWLLAQGIAAPGQLGIFGWSYGGYAAFQTSALAPDLFKAIVAVAPVTDLGMLKAESQSFTNTAIMQRFIGEGPHLQTGSPTHIVDQIKAPVLMFHGDRDQNVSVRESRVMSARLKAANRDVTYVEFPGLDHQLADPDARARVLLESDAFLRKAMGLPH